MNFCPRTRRGAGARIRPECPPFTPQLPAHRQLTPNYTELLFGIRLHDVQLVPREEVDTPARVERSELSGNDMLVHSEWPGASHDSGR